MSAVPATKTEIHQVIDQLGPDQLAQLAEYLGRLTGEPVAPIYQIHEQAVSTGIRDLADQHDHYLYGQDRHDA
jgi:hypothetical protein